MTTYHPDHNGECTHCDEPLDAHVCPAHIAELEREVARLEEALAEIRYALLSRVHDEDVDDGYAVELDIIGARMKGAEK